MYPAFPPLARAAAVRMGAEHMQARHCLHEWRDWSDASLARLIDAYPREKIELAAFGGDATNGQIWRRIAAGAASGADLVRRAREGGVWLTLPSVDSHVPELAELADALAHDLRRDAPWLRLRQRRLALHIASPRAQRPAEFEVTLAALFVLRGPQRCIVQPPQPCLHSEPETFHLAPGDWLSRPQFAAASAAVGDALSASLVFEFMTPRAALRAEQRYFIDAVRRRFGVSPRLSGAFTASGLAKAAAARVLRTLAEHATSEPPKRGVAAPNQPALPH